MPRGCTPPVGTNNKDKKMMIIAFSNKTSKILPRIFCGKFKHVAPITVNDDKLVLYQFVRYGNVVKIPLLARDIEILKAHGWRFVYLQNAQAHNVNTSRVLSCVQLAKGMIGMRCPHIQTPNALYNMIK